jgi:tetratricopeptide (TPR) repeat protein
LFRITDEARQEFGLARGLGGFTIDERRLPINVDLHDLFPFLRAARLACQAVSIASDYLMTSESNDNLQTPIEIIRALRRSGRAAEARALMRQMAVTPPSDVYIGQIGVDMNFLGLFKEAETFLRRALEEDHSLTNRYILSLELSVSLYHQGKYQEAHALLRVVRDRPYSEAVLEGVFSGDRFWVDTFSGKMLGMDEPVAGKRIYIPAEGGFGDFVNFSRYVERLFSEGAVEVVIEAFPEWAEVAKPRENLRFVLPQAEVRLEELARADRATFVFDLILRYQPSPYFPACDPAWCIATDPSKPLSADALALLQADHSKLKVGMIWRSASTARHEPYRSVQLAPLAPLLSDPNIQFYSLQVGELNDGERDIMQAHGIADLAPYLHSFGDTGHAFEQLDLVIAVDTGAAHLAGALNRPVWVLLAQACDHRWYDCQRFTPWYSSMRLYRQNELGDWSAPLADLQADLSRLAQSR